MAGSKVAVRPRGESGSSHPLGRLRSRLGRESLVRRLRQEEGIALIVVLLAAMVLSSLSLAVFQLSLHATDGAAYDDKRLQAITAAETGIDDFLGSIEDAVGQAVCDPETGDLVATRATWTTTVQIFDETGAELACTDDAEPDTALVTAVGSIGGTQHVSRTMQAHVRLAPVYGGFGNAIFAEQGLSVVNQLTVMGDVGDDGDLYTNGDFTSDNNTEVHGRVYAQGAALLENSGTVFTGVWANDEVHMANSVAVFGDVTSSTSSITLENSAQIQGDARAGTTITHDGTQISGTETPNSPQGPPPLQEFPVLVWDAGVQEAWEDAGFTVSTYTNCATAKAFIESGFTGSHVVRIATDCDLSWTNNSSVDLGGDLAIITDGSISTVNSTTFTGIGEERELFLMVAYPSTGAPDCSTGWGTISVSNLTQLNNLNTFVYSPCLISFGNNNSGGWNGQLIGGQVDLTNQMQLNYVPITVPSANLVGYEAFLSFIREI